LANSVLCNDHSANEILKGDFLAAIAANAGETSKVPAEAASVVFKKFRLDLFSILSDFNLKHEITIFIF
jgi:hypothetical protein